MLGSQAVLAADLLAYQLVESSSFLWQCDTRNGNGTATILQVNKRTRKLKKKIIRYKLNISYSKTNSIDQFTWIIGSKPQHNVTIVWHGYGVLDRGQIVLTMEQPSTVQIQCMLQINLLHICIGRTANTYYIESIAVQMEWMTKIGLLNCEFSESYQSFQMGNGLIKSKLPSSTSTISTMASRGMSILCVHIQFAPQSAGRLSPLQNCSGFMSSYWDSNGAGADK